MNMKTFIDDFIASKDPKFAGKSKAKRIEMAQAAYYAKQNESAEDLNEAVTKIATHTSEINPAITSTVHKNSDLGEYHVKWHLNGIHQPKDDYFTDDLADAHHTAKAGIKQHERIVRQSKNSPKLVNEAIEEYSLDEIVEYIQTEEYEKLDELSKQALSKYITKSAADAGINASIQRDFGKEENHASKMAAQVFKAKKEKRLKGIASAVEKLVKEDIDESVDKQSDHVADIINHINAADAPTQKRHLAYLKSILHPNDYNHIAGLLKPTNEEFELEMTEIKESLDEGKTQVVKIKSTQFPGIEAHVSKDDDLEHHNVKFYVDHKLFPKSDYNTKDKDDAHDVARKGIAYLEKSMRAQAKNEALLDAIDGAHLTEAKKILESIIKDKVSIALGELKEAIKQGRGDNLGVYHDTYRGALEHAYKTAKDKGYDLHDEEYHTSTAHVDPKPSAGETKRLHFPLAKADKFQKKQMHVQIYNRGSDVARPGSSQYELNHYIA